MYFCKFQRIALQEFKDQIEQAWDTEPEAVDEDNSIANQLELEDILCLFPVGEIASEVACGAEEEDDGGEYPEGAVQVGVGPDLFNELPLDGHEVELDPLNNFLLAHLKILLIKGKTHKSFTSRLFLLNLANIRLLIVCRFIICCLMLNLLLIRCYFLKHLWLI